MLVLLPLMKVRVMVQRIATLTIFIAVSKSTHGISNQTQKGQEQSEDHVFDWGRLKEE